MDLESKILLSDLNTFIEEVNRTNSRNEKIDIIKHFIREDLIICDLIKLIYDPRITFGVTSEAFKQGKNIDNGPKYENLMELLNDLRIRKLTGHNAIYAVYSFTDNNKEIDTIGRILDKNLKCRIDAKTINSAIPKCIDIFEVALANKHEDVKHRINIFDGTYSWSRKLDGVRVVAEVDLVDKKIKYFSREGNEFLVCNNLDQHIFKLFNNYYEGKYYLDGEMSLLTSDGKDDFRGVIKAIKRKSPQIENICYNIFDILSYDTFYGKKEESLIFSDRYDILHNLISSLDNKHIKIVKQTLIKSEEDFNKALETSRIEEWEGLILRKNTYYKSGRSNDLLKVKDFHDVECRCLRVEFGPFRIIDKEIGLESTIETMTNIVVDYSGNEVSVGSGFTLEERNLIYNDPSIVLEKMVTVQYFETTKNDKGTISLRFPTFKGIRNYE